MLSITSASQGLRAGLILLTIAYASQGVAVEKTCAGGQGKIAAKVGGDVLLQTRSLAGNASQHKGTSWHAYERRFPELAKMSKAERWSALEANWWYVFIDGKAHAKGVHAFDKPKKTSFDSGMQTSEHEKQVYELWKKPEAWGERWSVEKVEALNSVYRGLNCTIEPCGGSEIYKSYVPRYSWENEIISNEYLETDQNYTLTDIFPFPVPNCSLSPRVLPATWQKRAALASLLEDYYTAIDAASARESRAALQSGLPHLAKLFYRLADLHPFIDGNSRTRNLLLQTMLVELGGHPTAMWDDYWEIYFQPSLEAVQEKILHGWCAWEMAYQTGTSPFVVAGQNHSVPFLTYDPQSKSCREKLVPWPNVFGNPL